MDGWELARRRRIWAARIGPVLWIGADGMKPNPCYEVTVLQSPIKIYPPEYELVWRVDPLAKCAAVLTPYTVARPFVSGTDFDTVRVHHADGTDDVKIHEFPFPFAAQAQAAAKGTGDAAARPGIPQLYTGYSSVSFEEAYFNAVAQIPYAHPDELIHVVVVEQGGSHGGFAGINQLFVTVRRAELATSAGGGGGGSGGSGKGERGGGGGKAR